MAAVAVMPNIASSQEGEQKCYLGQSERTPTESSHSAEKFCKGICLVESIETFSWFAFSGLKNFPRLIMM